MYEVACVWRERERERSKRFYEKMYIRMVVSRTIRFLKRNTIDCLEVEMEQNMRHTNVIISFDFSYLKFPSYTPKQLSGILGRKK